MECSIMKVCYNIITTGKYHEGRCDGVALATWGKSCADRLLFFTDTPRSDDRFVVATNKTDYESSATLKLIYAIVHLPDLKFDWYVFGDDDTYFFTKRMEEYLTTADASRIHAHMWPRGKYEFDPELTWPSGGAGYAIPHSVLVKFAATLNVQPLPPIAFCGWGDVVVGRLIAAHSVSTKHTNLLRPDEVTPSFILGKARTTRYLSMHYVTPSIAQDLYKMETQ
jgi:hypothetical protein